MSITGIPPAMIQLELVNIKDAERAFREHKRREGDIVYAAIVKLRKAGHKVKRHPNPRIAGAHIVDGKTIGNATLMQRAAYARPRWP